MLFCPPVAGEIEYFLQSVRTYDAIALGTLYEIKPKRVTNSSVLLPLSLCVYKR